METEVFKLFTDAGSRGNPGKAAAAAVLLNWKDMLVDTDGKYLGITTNNVAEYEGLIVGLQLAMKHKCKHLQIFMDSQLVVRQITGVYKIKDHNLQERYRRVQEMLKYFDTYEFSHVYRSHNTSADKLVNMILDNN